MKSFFKRKERKYYLALFIVIGVIASSFLVIAGVIRTNAEHAAASTTSANISSPPGQYEAETAYLTGGSQVTTTRAGYNGSGYVANFTQVGASCIFGVNVPVAKIYAVTLHYANGTNAVNTLSIYVNGVKLLQSILQPTTGWADKTENLTLRAGLNTLSFVYASGDSGNISLDYISIGGGSSINSRGATLPYNEYQAENALTNGTVIGPDRTFTQLAAEAAGRKAVLLNAQGRYVEFTLTQPANAMDIRYSIPDAPDGTGLTASLSLALNGVLRPDLALTLTSKYGWFYGNYTFTNNPTDGLGHHFYDETHKLLGELPAGTKVRLEVNQGDNAPWYAIDLADFSEVPAAYTKPAGFVSIQDYGADPTGVADSLGAMHQAMAVARQQGEGVWIPSGTFRLSQHIYINNVTIRGAGPWYSTLHFTSTVHDMGLLGNSSVPGSVNVKLYDFAILGEVMARNDQLPDFGINGNIGGGSIFQNLWVEHTKAGIWLTGPSSNLLIVGCIVRDTTADGINFYGGISNSTVEQSLIRNTGDDGLAMSSTPDTDQNNVFRFNTVQNPVLANNIAIYGGANNSILDNIVSDTLTQGGGIHVGNRFHAVPLSGTTTIARNTLIRTGVLDQNWKFGVGALWFYALDEPMTGTISATENEIDDSSYEAIQFIGSNISNVTLSTITIKTAGTFAIQLQAGGSAQISNVTATNVAAGGTYDCNSGFTLLKGAGNAGWDDTHCENIRHPIIGNPPVIPGVTATMPPGAKPTMTPTPTPTMTPTMTQTMTPTPTATSVPQNGAMRIKNVTSGAYLYEANGSVLDGNPASNDTSSYWLIENSNGNVRIKNVATGDYLAIEHLTGYVEALHKIYDTWRSPQWMLTTSAAGGGTQVLRNYWHQDVVMQLAGQSGAVQYGPLPTDQAGAQWAFEAVV